MERTANSLRRSSPNSPPNLHTALVYSAIPDTMNFLTPVKDIEVVNYLPNSAWNGTNGVRGDEWEFHGMVFQAVNRQKLPPHPSCGNHNHWNMFVVEKSVLTNERRYISVIPLFDSCGQLYRVKLVLRPDTLPEDRSWIVHQFKAEKWLGKVNLMGQYVNLYNYELIEDIKNVSWQRTYLHHIKSSDTNQFCLNFAGYLRDKSLLDKSDVKWLTNLTETPWPRKDGSNLPYKI